MRVVVVNIIHAKLPIYCGQSIYKLLWPLDWREHSASRDVSLVNLFKEPELMNKKLTLVGGLVLVFNAVEPAAWAQAYPEPAASNPVATVGADLGLNSRYMFWGLTLSNRPVWQPDVYVTWNGLTAGVWGNFEFERQSSASDLTSGGDRNGNTEIDYWTEYAHKLGAADAKLGVIRWTYNKNNTGTLAPYATQQNFPGLDNGPDINSTEIYTAFTFAGVPLSPNLTLYYDVDLYRGLFGWVSVTKGVAIKDKTLNLSALTGFTFGEANLGHADIPLFAHEGLTHIDLSASMTFTAGACTITPNVHVQYNIDDVTKITSATQTDGRTVFTAGVTIAWSRGIGAK